MEPNFAAMAAGGLKPSLILVTVLLTRWQRTHQLRCCSKARILHRRTCRWRRIEENIGGGAPLPSPDSSLPRAILVSDLIDNLENNYNVVYQISKPPWQKFLAPKCALPARSFGGLRWIWLRPPKLELQQSGEWRLWREKFQLQQLTKPQSGWPLIPPESNS